MPWELSCPTTCVCSRTTCTPRATLLLLSGPVWAQLASNNTAYMLPSQSITAMNEITSSPS